MQFISKAQEKAYKKAMKKKYKAVAFDVDGTLTNFSRFMIPNSLARTLENLPEGLPMAICTGRPIQYITGELGHLVHKKNRYVFGENGGIGHKYDEKNDEFKKILDVKWPSERVTVDALEAFIKDKFGWHVDVSVRAHSVVVRYPEWFYLFPRFVRKISGKVAKQLRKLMRDMELDDILMVQDSGIGNIIIPRKSGKGKAMQAWAKKLKIPVSSILVVGDQGNEGENDEDFLDGKSGTSFTVGKQTKNVYPLPVLDEKTRKVWGPSGTNYLLNQLFTIG